MHKKSLLAVSACVTALAGFSAAPAFAGEITGPPGMLGVAGSATGDRIRRSRLRARHARPMVVNDMNPDQVSSR